MMIAKNLKFFDKVKGEMNKKAKIFTTELGKNTNKTVVTDVETTLVNIIKNTFRGYEVFGLIRFITYEERKLSFL